MYVLLCVLHLCVIKDDDDDDDDDIILYSGDQRV